MMGFIIFKLQQIIMCIMALIKPANVGWNIGEIIAKNIYFCSSYIRTWCGKYAEKADQWQTKGAEKLWCTFVA